MEAFPEVVFERVADLAVPDGRLIAQPAARSAALTPQSRDRVRGLVAEQRERVPSRTASGAGPRAGAAAAPPDGGAWTRPARTAAERRVRHADPRVRGRSRSADHRSWGCDHG
ncbi:hypothetical protein GCM10009834_11300 [Streptomonospora arabica]